MAAARIPNGAATSTQGPQTEIPIVFRSRERRML
jgi:hypothetical protein